MEMNEIDRPIQRPFCEGVDVACGRGRFCSPRSYADDESRHSGVDLAGGCSGSLLWRPFRKIGDKITKNMGSKRVALDKKFLVV